METSRVLLLVTTILLHGSIYASACLWSRLEHYPCTYKHPASTDKAGSNQQGEYLTTCGLSCEILKRKHKVQAIPQISSQYGPIFCLFSPGKNYHQPKNYINRNLVFYNVNCSGGQFIYFQMLEMDIENLKCHDTTVNQDKCVDYIQVNTPQGNTITDNCGKDKSNLDGEIFPFNSVQVIFRSNCHRRYPGFYATAICFNPQQAKSKSRGASDSCSERPVQRPTTVECQATSHKEIQIPYGHKASVTASAESTSIRIINLQNNRVTKRIDISSINTLSLHFINGTVQSFENIYRRIPPPPHTMRPPNLIRNIKERLELDSSSLQREFYRSSRIPSIPRDLQGPGILYVPKSSASSHACFQNYLVDVSRYIPSSEEKEIIKNIHLSLKNLVDKEEPVDESDDDDEESSEQSTLTRHISAVFKHLKQHKRSASVRKTDFIDESVYLSALQNEEGCNPVLKSSSAALVNALNRENPVEYRRLKQIALRRADNQEDIH